MSIVLFEPSVDGIILLQAYIKQVMDASSFRVYQSRSFSVSIDSSDGFFVQQMVVKLAKKIKNN